MEMGGLILMGAGHLPSRDRGIQLIPLYADTSNPDDVVHCKAWGRLGARVASE